VGESGAWFGDPDYNGSPNFCDVSEFFQLAYDNNAVLSNLRFSYVACALGCWANVNIWNCQFLNVDNAFCLGYGGGYSVGLHNVLITEAAGDYPIYSQSKITALENVTCDSPVPNGSFPGLITGGRGRP